MEKKLILKPIRTPASDLREDIFATVLNYLGRDYVLMMACDWGFRVIGNGKVDKLASCIDLERESVDICLRDYIGVSGCKEKVSTIKSFKKYIQNEIDKSLPLIIYVDTYGLSYHRTYNNKETSHIHQVLVNGYDEEKIYFMDVPWTLEQLSLTWEDCFNLLSPESYNVEHIIIKNDHSFGISQMLEMIIDKTTRLDAHGDMFDAIRLLGDMVTNQFDLERDVGSDFTAESLRFNPFIFGLDTIGRRRLTMVDVCDYIVDTYKIEAFKELSNLFQSISQAWIRLRYILIKGCCRGMDSLDEAKKNVGNRLIIIADKEKEILNKIIELKKIIDENKYVNKHIMLNNNDLLKNTVVEYVNLDGFFNNCGFHDSRNELKANFNISKKEYYISDNIRIKEYLQVGKMSFKIPELHCEKNDNVCCYKQNIDIEPEFYKSIMILGFAVYKGYAGSIQLVLDNDEKLEINIAFSNSSAYKPFYGETVAIKTSFFSREEINDASVFANEYMINTHRKIKRIVLPDWEMFSIMAISLRREIR